MKKRWAATLLIAGFLFMVCPVPGGAGDPIVLKMTSFLPAGDVNMTAWDKFVKDVNEKAAGRLVIKWIGGPEAVPGFKQFDAVRTGIVDIIFGAESYYGRQVSGAAYTHLSRLTPWEERANGYYDFRKELLEKQGVFYLGRAEYGTWFQVFTNKQVSKPQEIKGQKIRVSDTYEAFIKALDGVPVTIPGKDIYTALERGTVDGYAWSVLGNVKSGWVEVCKFILEPRIFQMNIEALVNLNKWNSLPDDLKKLMLDTMIANEKESATIMAALGEKELKQMQEKGMKTIKFTPEDSKWFVELAYKAQWADVTRHAPELGPKLEKLLSP
ncbi:MAG: TRAP transporter substrate-binding protein DctP [Pseudomonadota bacterium]